MNDGMIGYPGAGSGPVVRPDRTTTVWWYPVPWNGDGTTTASMNAGVLAMATLHCPGPLHVDGLLFEVTTGVASASCWVGLYQLPTVFESTATADLIVGAGPIDTSASGNKIVAFPSVTLSDWIGLAYLFIGANATFRRFTQPDTVGLAMRHPWHGSSTGPATTSQTAVGLENNSGLTALPPALTRQTFTGCRGQAGMPMTYLRAVKA